MVMVVILVVIMCVFAVDVVACVIAVGIGVADVSVIYMRVYDCVCWLLRCC